MAKTGNPTDPPMPIATFMSKNQHILNPQSPKLTIFGHIIIDINYIHYYTAKWGQFWGLGIQNMLVFAHKNGFKYGWVAWIARLRQKNHHFFNNKKVPF